MARITVAVVGAGVIGCLVARELAGRYPEVSITVFDRDAIGSGASRRSAGLHLPRGATPRIRRMAARSHAYYAALKHRHPHMPIYPVSATVITGRLPSDGLPSDGLAGGYLDLAGPAPAGPVLGGAVPVPDGSSAWRISGSHYTDVYRLAQAVAADLRPRVRFLEGMTVTRLAAGPDTVIIDAGTGERLAADFVVLAPGPWLSAPAWRDHLLPRGLRVKKIVALHIEQRPDPADEAVVFDDADAFLLPLAHRGHWLFSYTCHDWDVDPDALTAGLSATDLSAARDCLRRYCPALAGACGGGRMFCDAYSPGGEPLVGALDPAGRVVFAGGANGSGYRLAPAIAAQAVDLLPIPADGSRRLSPLAAAQSEGVRSDHQHV